jgi:hypothetical protein
LTSSAAADSILCALGVRTAYTGDVIVEVDIGTGAAGSEVSIGTFKFSCKGNASFWGPTSDFVLPLGIDNIGSGARVACRMRKSDTNTTAWRISATYLEKPFSGTFQTTAQPLTAAPSGVTLVTHGTGGTFNPSAWVQIVASTPNAQVIAGVLARGTPTGWIELEIGSGAAGSEVPLTKSKLVQSATLGPSAVGWLKNPYDGIASSTRVAMRVRGPSDAFYNGLGYLYYPKPL